MRKDSTQSASTENLECPLEADAEAPEMGAVWVTCRFLHELELLGHAGRHQCRFRGGG